jgi:hypothetical protein
MYFIVLYLFHSTVQGSHRDSTKQNKDLAVLTQQQHTAPSNNLNNPSATKNSAVTTADSDVNKNGPYFDVAASKNVRTYIRIANFIFKSRIQI